MASEPHNAASGELDGAIPLSELREGQFGRVHSLCSHCRHGYGRGGGRRGGFGRRWRGRRYVDAYELLRAMGISEGCRLRVCHHGRRCIVQVNATRLGISNAIARNILVSPVSENT